MPIPHRTGLRSDRIRLATIEDVQAIYTLDITVFGDIDGGYPDFFFGHMLTIFPSTFWIIPDIGYCFIMLGERSPWLYTLAVHPDYQGQGYGSDLLKHAEYSLRLNHFLTLCLTVDKSNNRAIQFYRNHHYRIIGKRIDVEPEKIVMRKAL